MTKYLYLPGEWYIVITCGNCKERCPVFHDLTKGSTTINPVYVWQCPHCKHKGTYEGEAVERYQHPIAAVAGQPNGSA